MSRSPLLSGRALTYKPAGLTLPEGRAEFVDHAGFRVRERTVRISSDWTWESVSAAVLEWQVKRRSGFRVTDDDGRRATSVTVGDRRWLTVRLGPWKLSEPVRVIRVVEEDDRVGFAYGTLEGHPLSGEEAFVVERSSDGIHLTLRSVSRPASGLWYLAYPALMYAQVFYRRRYLRAFT